MSAVSTDHIHKLECGWPSSCRHWVPDHLCNSRIELRSRIQCDDRFIRPPKKRSMLDDETNPSACCQPSLQHIPTGSNSGAESLKVTRSSPVSHISRTYFLATQCDQRLFLVIAIEVIRALTFSVVPRHRLACRTVIFRNVASDCENSASNLARYHARYLVVPVVFVPAGARPYLQEIVSVHS